MGQSSDAKMRLPRDAVRKVAQQRLNALGPAMKAGNVAETCRQCGMDRKVSMNENGSTGLSEALKNDAAGQGRCGFAARSGQSQALARPQAPLEAKAA